MPAWLLLVAMSAAAYRLGRLVALDTIWEGWRDKLREKLTMGDKLSVWKLKLDELITCPFCITGWTSALVVAATYYFERFPLPVLCWLAVWTGALLFWGTIDDADDGPKMQHG